MRIHVPSDDGRTFDTDDVTRIVHESTSELYGANVSIAAIRQIAHNSVQVRLKVLDPAGLGNRGAGYAPCYHVYRDVLRALYREYPTARVTTGIARYVSADHFEAAQNAGLAPAAVGCTCGEEADHATGD